MEKVMSSRRLSSEFNLSVILIGSDFQAQMQNQYEEDKDRLTQRRRERRGKNLQAGLRTGLL